MITMPTWLTVKPLLAACALLVALLITQTVRLDLAQSDTAVAVASTKTAQAEAATARTERDAHKLAAEGAANRANGWQVVATERQGLLSACQAENARIRGANADAIARAKAEAASAGQRLNDWVNRYAAAIRSPDCAAARRQLDLACPASDY